MTLKSLSTLTVISVVATIGVLAVSTFTPPTSLAQGKGSGGGGGGGGGSSSENNFDVGVVSHIPDAAFPGVWDPGTTLYAPTDLNSACLGDTPGSAKNYTVRMPDEGDVPPNGCAAVTLNGIDGQPLADPYYLTDDIYFDASANKGVISSVRFHAQDVIGEDGIYHESDDMPLAVPVVVPSDASQGMVLHVHQASVLVQRFSKHQGGKAVEEVGYIAVGDLIYVPQP